MHRKNTAQAILLAILIATGSVLTSDNKENWVAHAVEVPEVTVSVLDAQLPS